MRHTPLYQIVLTTTAVLAALGLVACQAAPQPQGMVVHASDKPRQEAQGAAAPDLAALVAGNNAFALDLYHALYSEQDNLLCAPYSISLALAMAYAGARGETERQMAETLHFDLPQAQLHPTFNALDQALASRGEGEQDFRLHVVNAMWGQQGYTFLDAYLDALAVHYGAGMRTLDMAQAPEAARQAINDWASKETEARIEDLLPPGSIDPATVLVLANAIYFQAAWAEPFLQESTTEDTFTLLDSTTVPVQMMNGAVSVRYAQGKGYQAIELPYSGGETAMLILLPDEGTFAGMAESLDGAQVAAIAGTLEDTRVALSLPRFSTASGFELAETLGAMGMPAAFSGADFSGIDGTRELFIDQVTHRTFITVDEQGTEAAGATAVVMKWLSMPPSLRIDRPFIYAIRDVETGSLLFVGQVIDPSTPL
jgi:serine protease inhibitor